MNLPNFHYEKKVWKRNYRFVAGLDEVGRGAFAGPVVAGCVVFKFRSPNLSDVVIDDSKRLTVKKREAANVWIKENCLTWGIGEASAGDIDKLGIVKATNKAMRKAIGNANQRLHERIQYILIDAFYIPYIRGIRMPLKRQRVKGKITEQESKTGQQTTIVKGDQKSLSIAAASVIAKVYRDNLMINLSKKNKNKKYHWEMNKGYGTKIHKHAIKRYGIVKLHRRSFVIHQERGN